MKHNNIIYVVTTILMGFMLTGCYQDIDLDKYKNEEGEYLLTINSAVNPDSVVAVAATRTYFYSDTHKGREYVKGLDISLYVNGKENCILQYNASNNLYESDYRPKENDEIELKTLYRNQIVESKDTIPEKVKIESIEITRQGPLSIYFNNDYIITYYITFNDPIGKDNYYFLQYDDIGAVMGNMSMGERDYTYEYVFQQLANHINASVPGWEPYSPEGLPFSDNGIDGTTHTLVVKEIVSSNRSLAGYPTMRRKIKLFSISESYYQYLLSKLYNDPGNEGLHGGMIDLGVSEPIKYFSNINGGTGILAAYSLDETELDVIQILGPFPK